MDYYPQIAEARRLIAEHAGWSPFRLRTTVKGVPRWDRTEGCLLVSEPLLAALRRGEYIRECYSEGRNLWRAPRDRN